MSTEMPEEVYQFMGAFMRKVVARPGR